MATDAPKFVANHKEYVDIYEIFSRIPREQEQVWVENELIPKLTEFFRSENSTLKSEFKVLAVGSGVGSFDCMFIDVLLTRGKSLIEGKQISWVVVEPSAVAIDEFKRRVYAKGASYQNIKFSWVNKGVEEFLNVTDTGQYDMIQFMHVLYYIKEEEILLKNTFDRLLGSPGCIVVAVGAEGNIWEHIIKTFQPKIPSLDIKQPTNIQLSEISKRNGWAYETFIGKLDLEVTDVLDEGNPNGEALLKFLFQVNEEPQEKFGKNLMSEILEFFQKMSTEKTKDGKKCFFVNEDEGLLLLYKQS